MTVDARHLGRFSLSSTPRLQQLLEQALQDSRTSQVLKELCQQHKGKETVPWRIVQCACRELREHTPHTDKDSLVLQPAPYICKDAKLVLPNPPARQRSQQLVERLAKIQNKVDEERYAAMVADVAHMEQKAAAQSRDPFFPNTRMQLSFGLHVVVTMGTFSALGYLAGRILFQHETLAALLAVVGLTAGLLLEAILLIVRTNMPAPLDKRFAHLLDKRWDTQGSIRQKQKTPTGGKLHSNKSQLQHDKSLRNKGVQAHHHKAE